MKAPQVWSGTPDSPLKSMRVLNLKFFKVPGLFRQYQDDDQRSLKYGEKALLLLLDLVFLHMHFVSSVTDVSLLVNLDPAVHQIAFKQKKAIKIPLDLRFS